MAVRIDGGLEASVSWQSISWSSVQGCIHVTLNLNGNVTGRQVLTQFRPTGIELINYAIFPLFQLMSITFLSL